MQFPVVMAFFIVLAPCPYDTDFFAELILKKHLHLLSLPYVSKAEDLE